MGPSKMMPSETDSSWFEGERGGPGLAERLREAELAAGAGGSGGAGGPGLDRLAVVESMCDRHFDLIRMADHKAQFLFRMTMMLFGAAFIGVPPSVVVLKRFLNEGGAGAIILFSVIGLLYLVCATCLLMAMGKI